MHKNFLVKKKLVSIILNCYNGETYLQESLESIENQTYSNWELIFWDNQSTDRSKEILFNFFKKKKNKRKVKYFRAKKHSNLYSARNFAVSKSKGEFIAFIDADDVWDINKLNNQIKLFEDKEVDVVYGNLWIRKEKFKKKKKFIKNKLPEGFIFKDLIKKYCVGIVTAVIRKKIFKNNKKIFNKNYNIIGDFDLFIRLSKKYKFKAIQEPVATYRLHDKNLSNNKNEISELKYWLLQNKKFFNKNLLQSVKKKN